jgi:hypothetical protein
VRPSAPNFAGSIVYSLAQDGHTMSMTNQGATSAFKGLLPAAIIEELG